LPYSNLNSINTLRQQHQAYQAQLKEAKEQFEVWTKRATDLAASDQKKALQCVARRNQCEADIGRLQTKLNEMTQKHSLMRSRQTVADVNRAVACANTDDNLNDTFERWESTVLEHEFAVSDACSGDSLDLELTRAEDEADLLAQLQIITDDAKQAENTNE
jgi:neutral trehalase